MELYKKYRPKKFEGVVGQDAAMKVLVKKVKRKNVPHTILLTGPSGCGKTTVARILKRMLKCSNADFVEANTASERGIDDIRKIKRRIQQVPMDGDCRIWLIDEAHKLSNDAQNAFLKMLEDTPKHVYFILASTHPQKIIKAIRTRSSEFKLKGLSDKDLASILRPIAKKENFKIPKAIERKIIENCGGSARKCLVMLDQIIDLEKEKDMEKVIAEALYETAAYDLCKKLMKPRTSWKSIAAILLPLQQQQAEVESIRHSVLGYTQSALLKGWGDQNQAYIILDAFRDHFYDCKFPGLVAACYEVINCK